MSRIDHPSVQRVQAALDAAGIAGEIRILSEAAPTAKAAADQVGVAVGAIANSLIFDADGEPLLVMTSGAHRVDTAKVAAAIGVAKLDRATPEFVATHTGQKIGGVAPAGHPAPIRTLIDADLAQYPQLWAAGGVPHAVFPLSYDELVSLSSGTEIAVT